MWASPHAHRLLFMRDEPMKQAHKLLLMCGVDQPNPHFAGQMWDGPMRDELARIATPLIFFYLFCKHSEL